MTDAEDVRRPCCQPQRVTQAGLGKRSVAQRFRRNLCPRFARLPGHHFDAVSIGVCQAHDPAAARLVQPRHRHAFGLGQRFQIGEATGAQPHGQEPCRPRFGGMHERPSIARPGIKPTVAFKAGQAEILQKCPHRAKIRRGEAHVGDIFDLDHRHGRFSPGRMARIVSDYMVKYVENDFLVK